MSRLAIAVASALVLLGASAVADPIVTYLGPLDTYPIISHETTADCMVGNFGQPGAILEDLGGMVSIGVATTIDPMAYDCPCGSGFTVTGLHVVMAKVDTVQGVISLEFGLGGGWLRNTYPDDARCFHPYHCPSYSYGYNMYCVEEASAPFPQLGYYEITFPVSSGGCDCIYTSYTHTITMWEAVEWLLAQGLMFVTDVNPDHCPDHFAQTYFLGSCRWYEIPGDGNLLFWAEVACCDNPVDIEKVTWGTFKSLYRQLR